MSATAPAAIRRRLCETRNGYVHVRESGSGHVPLVLLHFTPYSGLAFEAVLPLFAQTRRVIAVDRVGFGMSDSVASHLSMEEYALTTLDALDDLGVECFDLVGVHTGAVEALEIATAHEVRARRVVLVALPVWSDAERRFLHGFTGSFVQDARADGSHLLAMWNGVQRMGRGHYPSFGADESTSGELHNTSTRTGWPDEQVQGFVLHYMLAGPRWHWIYPAIAAFPAAERLTALRQPVLFIRTHDDIWEQQGRAIALLPSHAHCVTLPHLDMVAFAAAPAEMVSRIEAFLGADR